jgi:acyl-coenzyme A synthetase/AMP-(fatty) acid ligase
MPHRAIVNLVDWQRGILPLEVGARVLQFAPLSFDVSFQEIFSTWALGGTLVLVDDAMRRDPQALWRVIIREKIERVFLPYVSLQALAEQAPAELPESLRDVITAGEQLRITPQIWKLFSRLKHVRLHNHYGPTETHVCTAHTLLGDPAEWPLLPPIGQPIAHTETLLLDEQQQASDEGELYVGGTCLAEGYFRRPDLTGERFVTIDGRRFYRTGDLARRADGGPLEFLGRADDQLKVRGFRVEPGEIEAQLSQHPAVRECAVTSRDQWLLAYWVGESVATGELRDFLAGRLAAHLVPSFYTRLEAMPVSASGKINRRALRAPDAPAEFASHAQPSSQLETTIARIWAGVLRLPSVPRDVNFGDLGGTSLHAAEAQAALGGELQRELPVALLYEYPTVAALARALEGNGTGASLGKRMQSRAAAQRAAMNQRANGGRRRPQPADA